MGDMARRQAGSFSLTRLRNAAEIAKERDDDDIQESLKLREELITLAATMAGFPGIPVERSEGKVTFSTGLRVYESLFDATVKSVVQAADEGTPLRSLAVRRAVAAAEEALVAELGDDVDSSVHMALDAARSVAEASAKRFRDEEAMERVAGKAMRVAVDSYLLSCSTPRG